MTNYHLTPSAPLPSRAVQEAKEKRRKVLEAAAQTRKANYERFLRRMASLEKTLREKNRQLHGSGEVL
jgi:flagellar motility protein MotE (MotC chaperone)